MTTECVDLDCKINLEISVHLNHEYQYTLTKMKNRRTKTVLLGIRGIQKENDFVRVEKRVGKLLSNPHQ